MSLPFIPPYTNFPDSLYNSNILGNFSTPAPDLVVEGSKNPTKEGTPASKVKGAEKLWKVFFTYNQHLTREAWITNTKYFRDLFDLQLTFFVKEFLPNIAPIPPNNPNNKANIQTMPASFVNYNDFFSRALSEDPSTFKADEKAQIKLASRLLNYIPNLNVLVQGGSSSGDLSVLIDTLKNLMQSADVPDAETYFISGRWNEDDNKNDTTHLSKAFEIYLKSSNLQMRTQGILEFVIRTLTNIINSIQLMTESQSNRVSVYTKAQNKATSAMAAIKFVSFSSTTDVSSVTKNQTLQGYITIYQTGRDLMQALQKGESGAVNSANNSIQDTSRVIVNLITTLDSLITSIFIG